MSTFISFDTCRIQADSTPNSKACQFLSFISSTSQPTKFQNQSPEWDSCQLQMKHGTVCVSLHHTQGIQKPPKVSPPYLLTPWSRGLLEKLTGSAASQEIPRIFGTPRFITVLTNARHLSLFWANSFQSSQPPSTSRRSILILCSHVRLPTALRCANPLKLSPCFKITDLEERQGPRVLCDILPTEIRRGQSPPAARHWWIESMTNCKPTWNIWTGVFEKTKIFIYKRRLWAHKKHVSWYPETSACTVKGIMQATKITVCSSKQWLYKYEYVNFVVDLCKSSLSRKDAIVYDKTKLRR